MNLLIVEDKNEISQTLKLLLSDLFSNIWIKANGFEAAEFVTREGVPDLVLCDVEMPIMDGMEFLTFFREKISKDSLFFIMTGGSKYTRDEFKTAGASNYFEKPITINELLNAIETHVNRHLIEENKA